ncbi:MAG: VOC family protein [Chitinophagaceae bacterium]
MSHPVYPCIWFDGNAAEAADFYIETFGKGAVTAHNPVVTSITLSGEPFMLLNGGPMFRPNPSISFYVVCETIEEVDDAWKKLEQGGQVLMPLGTYPWSSHYGWIQDKYGVSWQLAFGKMSDVGQKFAPLLLFSGAQNGKAEEALNLYTDIFPDSISMGIARYQEGEGDTPGHVKHEQFRINGFVMMGIDSGHPHPFSFNEGISLVVSCRNQEEIDHYWEKLTDNGGSESMCGWLKDKFGVSWQIVFDGLGSLMSSPERSAQVMERLMKMKKLIIADLENA